MANRTVKEAKYVKGTNPQYLIEKITRSRIYECKYWKEECFALTAELLVDKALLLRYIGGTYGGNIKPTPFMCLILKMLQIQPDKDIIVEFITQQDFKYVRALGAFYMRLTGSSIDCYKYLEPLYLDYRKLRIQNKNGGFELSYMDEFIDSLFNQERVCDIILPRLQKRSTLEESNQLEPRVSALEEDLEAVSLPLTITKTPKKDKEKDHDRSKRKEEKRKKRSRDRDRGNDKDRRSKSRSPKPKRKVKDKTHKELEKEEINEQNAIRAKLGLAPLRP